MKNSVGVIRCFRGLLPSGGLLAERYHNDDLLPFAEYLSLAFLASSMLYGPEVLRLNIIIFSQPCGYWSSNGSSQISEHPNKQTDKHTLLKTIPPSLCWRLTQESEKVSKLTQASLLCRAVSRWAGPTVIGFLPCDALRCTVSVIVILSVCPSVRLSHSWTVSTRFDLRS